MTNVLPKGRDLTRIAILSMLGRSGPSSRADIARDLGINAVTVTQMTKLLIQDGLVEELNQAPSTGGRPGQLLGIVAGAGRALGVKLTRNQVVIDDVRIDGTVLDTYSESFDAFAPEAPNRLASLLRPFVQRRSDVPLLGVGVAVPGIVDSPDSGIVDANTLGWSKVPLGGILKWALGLPVLVENDVKSVTVSEQIFGRGRTLNDFFVVSIGFGIGLGVVVGGSLYRGSRGGAGEFGHYTISEGGQTCTCGNRGCLETEIGAPALVEKAKALGIVKANAQIEDLQLLAVEGNEEARSVFHDAGIKLARALSPLITVLDPERVIILGEGSIVWQYWEPGFRSVLDKFKTGPVVDTPIEVEPWNDAYWAQGAAALVLATPFNLEGLAGRQTKQVLARLNRAGVS